MKPVGLARRLRREATDAERRLWSRLRDRQVDGVKFRRQMPIGTFVADFASVEAKLVIEVDGSQHAQAVEADRLRSDALGSAGYLVFALLEQRGAGEHRRSCPGDRNDARRPASAKSLRHWPLTLFL